jgi:poly(3-hydroxybutyrate) depolymerase
VRACRDVLAALASRAAAAILATHAATALAAPLRSYDIDRNEISVSGLSSGAFMAVQMHVAYSATFRKGVGIVAGGAFYCAANDEGRALRNCMDAQAYGVPALLPLHEQAARWAAEGAIDPTANLAASRVWLFTGGRSDTGTHDTTVDWRVVDQARDFYLAYVDASHIAYKSDLRAEHEMPTQSWGHACRLRAEPYIATCHYDAAGAMLAWLHGAMKPRNPNPPAANLIEFDQSEFVAEPGEHGMWATGFAYVPARCAARARCKLHVAFHGCKQYPGYIYYDWSRSRMMAMERTFALHAGYNEWADTNDIIVLYPQADALYFGRGGKSNPYGCWDWWGYDDDRYARKDGRQMRAVKAMVDRVTGARR